MKIQSINEMLDTNDIIKKSILTQQEKNDLEKNYKAMGYVLTEPIVF